MTPRLVTLRAGSSAAVILLGFAALRLGGELPAPTAALALGAMLWRGLRGPPRVGARVWVALQLGFLIWLGLGWALLGKQVLTVFSQLLVFVQVHRVLTGRGARDDIYSSFIAFGMVLLASVLTFSPLWFLLLVAFLVTFVWATLLARLALSVEASWAEQHPGLPVPAARWRALDPLLSARSFAAVTGLNALLLLGTVGLFFLLPRMQISLLSGGLGPPVHVTGFSDRVRLGDLGLLQLSNEPVMRVRAFDAEGAPADAQNLYWRGLALDRFDGTSWSLSDDRREPLVALRRGDGPPQRSPWSLRLETTLEPLDSRILFVVPRAAGIYGDFTTLEAASPEGYYLTTPRRRENYVVYSDPSPPDARALRASDPRGGEPAFLLRYTQLPRALSPRVAEIAEGWAAGAPTALDEALLIQERLRSDFTYSLDQPASAYPDPIEAFLDTVKEGHCEYFATAMTLMLRTRGLPARLVNGFSGAEWNPVGGYWVVRQSHAHSWVELWFPGQGWVLFDPTPSTAGGLSAGARRGLAVRLGQWADWGTVLWADVMLDYDLSRQVDGFGGALRRLASLSSGGGERSARDAPEDTGSGGFGWLPGLALALLAVGTVLGIAKGVTGPRGTARAVDRLHRRLRAAAEGSEGSPPASAPPLAFARWAARRDPGRFGDAPAVVEGFYAARFGGHPLGRDLGSRGRRLARASRGWTPPPEREVVPRSRG